MAATVEAVEAVEAEAEEVPRHSIDVVDFKDNNSNTVSPSRKRSFRK
jgi:hypothetical protein